MRELVSALGFGAPFAAPSDGPRVAYVPVVRLDDDTQLALHIARGDGLRGIVGFRLEIQAWRGTKKLGQHKPDAARAVAADGAEAAGRRAIAHWMREGLA